MTDHTLAVLQTVRLKGRVSPDGVAAAVNITPAQAARRVEALTAQGYLDGGEFVRITPGGCDKLAKLLAGERADVDLVVVEDIYADFHQLNSVFTALKSDWQIRNGARNGRRTASHDAELLVRLKKLHNEFQPVLDRMAIHLPRLQPYSDRFSSALQRVIDGDRGYFLRSAIDSYHTVWFELHIELIGMLGRKRDDEARAGRAQ